MKNLKEYICEGSAKGKSCVVVHFRDSKESLSFRDSILNRSCIDLSELKDYNGPKNLEFVQDSERFWSSRPIGTEEDAQKVIDFINKVIEKSHTVDTKKSELYIDFYL